MQTPTVTYTGARGVHDLREWIRRTRARPAPDQGVGWWRYREGDTLRLRRVRGPRSVEGLPRDPHLEWRAAVDLRRRRRPRVRVVPVARQDSESGRLW